MPCDRARSPRSFRRLLRPRRRGARARTDRAGAASGSLRSGTLRRYLAPGAAIAASAAVIAFVAVPLLQSPPAVAPGQQVALTAVPVRGGLVGGRREQARRGDRGQRACARCVSRGPSRTRLGRRTAAGNSLSAHPGRRPGRSLMGPLQPAARAVVALVVGFRCCSWRLATAASLPLRAQERMRRTPRPQHDRRCNGCRPSSRPRSA